MSVGTNSACGVSAGFRSAGAAMRTTDFDAIATAAPLNREASTVRDGSGDQWEAKTPPTAPRWIAPPPLRSERDVAGSGVDMLRAQVGRRYGRLTVLGIWADSNPNQKSVWVCRCDCGAYEGRRLGRLTSGAVTMCLECAQVEAIRSTKTNTAEYRRQAEKRLDKLARRERAKARQ